MPATPTITAALPTPSARRAGHEAPSQNPTTTANSSGRGAKTATSIIGYQIIPLARTRADARSPSPLKIASALGLLIIGNASPAPTTSEPQVPPGVHRPNR